MAVLIGALFFMVLSATSHGAPAPCDSKKDVCFRTYSYGDFDGVKANAGAITLEGREFNAYLAKENYREHRRLLLANEKGEVYVYDQTTKEESVAFGHIDPSIVADHLTGDFQFEFNSDVTSAYGKQFNKTRGSCTHGVFFPSWDIFRHTYLPLLIQSKETEIRLEAGLSTKVVGSIPFGCK